MRGKERGWGSMSESEVQIARLDERVKDLEDFKVEVSQDLKSIRAAQNGILGGIIVALVLLVINLAVGR